MSQNLWGRWFRKGTDCCRPICGHQSDMENNQNFFRRQNTWFEKLTTWWRFIRAWICFLCVSITSRKNILLFTYQEGLNLDVQWLLFGSKTAENSSVQNRPGLNIVVNRIYLFLDAIEKVHLVVNKVHIFLRLKNLKILVWKFWIKCLKVVELITSHYYTKNPLKEVFEEHVREHLSATSRKKTARNVVKIQNFRRVFLDG